MKFADLCNRHAGQSVLICGTGPSLDLLDADAIRGPRIYLNRSAFALPASAGETYWLVCDDAWAQGIPGPWARHLDDVRSGDADTVGVFRDPLMAGKGINNPPPTGDNIVTFGVNYQPRRDLVGFGREAIADMEMLYQQAGTAAPAIHLAWFMGADHVMLAGIDGNDGYANRLQKFYDKPARGGLGYRLSFEDGLWAADRLRVNVSFIKEHHHANV